MHSFETLDKIYKIYKDNYRCLNDESHENFLFCFECNKFFCEKCSEIHDKSHKNIKSSDIIEKLDSYKTLFNSIELEREKAKQTLNRFSEVIKNLNDIYKNLNIIFELRLSIIKKKKANEEIVEIKTEDIDSLYNKIIEENNFENKGKYFIDYFKLLETAVKENKNNILYKKIIKVANSLNKQIIEQNNMFCSNLENNNLFKKLKDIINSTEAIFYQYICKNLNVSHKEYIAEKNLINFKKNIEDVKKENHIDLHKSQIIINNQTLNDYNKDQINEYNLENKKEKILKISLGKSFGIIANNPHKQLCEEEKPIKLEKEIMEKKSEENKFNDENIPILNLNIQKSDNFLNIKKEDNVIINREEEKNNIINDLKDNNNIDINKNNEINLNGNNDSNEINFKNDYILDNPDLNCCETLVYNSTIKNGKLDRSTIFMDSFEVYTEEDIADIMIGNQSKNIFDNIKTIRQIKSEEIAKIQQTKNTLEKESDIEKHRKSCKHKIKELNKKINIYCSPISEIVKEIKVFNIHERNLIELISPKNNGEYIYVFNPYLNEIEDIIIPPSFKFPKNFAYINILPYCYVSGGIQDDNSISKNFFAIKRKGYKVFEFVKLPNMLNQKYNHCMIELKTLGGLGIIGGWNSKKCEYFNLKKKEWKSLPDLNHIRESPTCCVINEKNIFCFLGYDNELKKYNETFEKCNLQTKRWEEINPGGMKNFMERKAAGCLIYNHRGKDFIIIVGGINNSENELKDILIYDEKRNAIERKKNRLPFKCSFSHNSFHLLCSGYYSNFDNNSSIIQYEEFQEVFFGLSEI